MSKIKKEIDKFEKLNQRKPTHLEVEYVHVPRCTYLNVLQLMKMEMN